ncbi:hypothetical protein BV25DRAFT_1841617 [Artomyces pyxidatus]|uniref:Uncharacterized protein n=1 Tax=Artomyces pyxidatus TaxID=48021 RepID=A0ACB8SMR0_9AGAM|nr:hypothetical protein BV25DRAFT_1841617 [Artomyces pyxidatus]
MDPEYIQVNSRSAGEWRESCLPSATQDTLPHKFRCWTADHSPHNLGIDHCVGNKGRGCSAYALRGRCIRRAIQIANTSRVPVTPRWPDCSRRRPKSDGFGASAGSDRRQQEQHNPGADARVIAVFPPKCALQLLDISLDPLLINDRVSATPPSHLAGTLRFSASLPILTLTLAHNRGAILAMEISEFRKPYDFEVALSGAVNIPKAVHDHITTMPAIATIDTRSPGAHASSQMAPSLDATLSSVNQPDLSDSLKETRSLLARLEEKDRLLRAYQVQLKFLQVPQRIGVARITARPNFGNFSFLVTRQFSVSITFPAHWAGLSRRGLWGSFTTSINNGMLVAATSPAVILTLGEVCFRRRPILQILFCIIAYTTQRLPVYIWQTPSLAHWYERIWPSLSTILYPATVTSWTTNSDSTVLNTLSNFLSTGAESTKQNKFPSLVKLNMWMESQDLVHYPRPLQHRITFLLLSMIRTTYHWPFPFRHLFWTCLVFHKVYSRFASMQRRGGLTYMTLMAKSSFNHGAVPILTGVVSTSALLSSMSTQRMPYINRHTVQHGILGIGWHPTSHYSILVLSLQIRYIHVTSLWTWSSLGLRCSPVLDAALASPRGDMPHINIDVRRLTVLDSLSPAAIADALSRRFSPTAVVSAASKSYVWARHASVLVRRKLGMLLSAQMWSAGTRSYLIRRESPSKACKGKAGTPLVRVIRRIHSPSQVDGFVGQWLPLFAMCEYRRTRHLLKKALTCECAKTPDSRLWISLSSSLAETPTPVPPGFDRHDDDQARAALRDPRNGRRARLGLVTS